MKTRPNLRFCFIKSKYVNRGRCCHCRSGLRFLIKRAHEMTLFEGLSIRYFLPYEMLTCYYFLSIHFRSNWTSFRARSVGKFESWIKNCVKFREIKVKPEHEFQRKSCPAIHHIEHELLSLCLSANFWLKNCVKLKPEPEFQCKSRITIHHLERELLSLQHGQLWI